MALAAVSVLVLACCHASGEQWSFRVTRAVLESSAGSYEGYASEDAGLSGGPELALIVLLPVAVDLIVLPITVPHDLLFMD